MVLNKSLVAANYLPSGGYPAPGKDLVIKEEELDLDAPIEDGTLLLKTLWLSFDPFQRGRLNPPATGTGNSYVPPLELGTPLSNAGILVVLKSTHPAFTPGSLVLGMALFSEYQIPPPSLILKSPYEGGFIPLSNPLSLPPQLFLGALGMSGLTAFSSLYELGKPQKGKTLFISAASGAVGQIVGQLGKREGMRVLGSVGSKEKLDFIVKVLGFDGGFVYKDEDIKEGFERVLEETGGGKIGIYYDNVGGEQLDVAISCMEDHGRIVQCGNMSQQALPPSQKYGIKNMGQVIQRRLKISGFVVSDPDLGPVYYEKHQQKLGEWIKNGEIVVKMDVTEGIENAAEGFAGMLTGKNFGKAVLKVADL